MYLVFITDRRQTDNTSHWRQGD